ncbi:hypothetical protein [Promicromonospora sp. NFX87]|uniref:hypothetical protein n=1 Tax=Promicromonospora sp. NFX87 TaxID=3402691 RepID=UPI003AFA41E7
MSNPHEPNLARVLAAFIGARGLTAGQIAELLGRPIGYVEQQLTGVMALRMDVTGALGLLSGMSPEAVLEELSRLSGQGESPASEAGAPVPDEATGAVPPSAEGRAASYGPTVGIPSLHPKRPRGERRPHRTAHHLHRPDEPDSPES